MARRTVTDCDRCKKENVETKPFFIRYGNRIDIPSGKTESLHARLDLCFQCVAFNLERNWVDGMSEEAGKELLRKLGIKY